MRSRGGAKGRSRFGDAALAKDLLLLADWGTLVRGWQRPALRGSIRILVARSGIVIPRPPRPPVPQRHIAPRPKLLRRVPMLHKALNNFPPPLPLLLLNRLEPRFDATKIRTRQWSRFGTADDGDGLDLRLVALEDDGAVAEVVPGPGEGELSVSARGEDVADLGEGSLSCVRVSKAVESPDQRAAPHLGVDLGVASITLRFRERPGRRSS